MHGLFLRGAIQGATPGEAYFVRCDGGAVSGGDRARGVVRVDAGFAPLRPAEFVVVRVEQRTAGAPA